MSRCEAEWFILEPQEEETRKGVFVPRDVGHLSLTDHTSTAPCHLNTTMALKKPPPPARGATGRHVKARR